MAQYLAAINRFQTVVNDYQTTTHIPEALERLVAGRTVIAIAHRLSTLRNAEKIIVVKDGEVAEDGTHQQLVALDGVYAQLHRLQFEPRRRPQRIGAA